MASQRNGTLYIGMTNNLPRRVMEHKTGFVNSFSKKYKTVLLVYYEIHRDVDEAILKEKQMKKWKREWKINLIEKSNPGWEDLYDKILE
jgi:putative endonuclease